MYKNHSSTGLSNHCISCQVIFHGINFLCSHLHVSSSLARAWHTPIYIVVILGCSLPEFQIDTLKLLQTLIVWIALDLRNRIRCIPPSCPVGNESDTIRVRHEADSTFGRIRNRDTNSPSNQTQNPSNRENRTRTPKNRTHNPWKETVQFT